MDRIYTIINGKKETSFQDNEVKYRGNWRCVDLELASLKAAEQVIEIAGLNCYMIESFEVSADGWYSMGRGKMEFKTQDIVDYEQAKEQQAQDYTDKQERMVVAVNAMPKVFGHDLGLALCLPGITFWIERSEAQYKPNVSRAMTGGNLQMHYKVDSGRAAGRNDLYVSGYISSNNKLLANNLKKDAGWRFGKEVKATVEAGIGWKGLLQTLKDQLEIVERKINKVKENA